MTTTTTDTNGPLAVEPSNLTVALRIARRMLAAYGTVDSDNIYAYTVAHGGLTEGLRLLLRALDAEHGPSDGAGTAQRCPAAQVDDSPCGGPLAVTVYAARGAGVDGCEHHATQLLAAADGLHPVSLPDADGAAHRVFRAAASLRYFAAHQGGGR